MSVVSNALELTHISKDGFFEIVRTPNGGICSKGVARMYSEQGLPLAASAQQITSDGLQISWLNVASDFVREGMAPDKILSSFSELLHFQPDAIDIEIIEKFLLSDYHKQREMLWEYWKPMFCDGRHI